MRERDIVEVFVAVGFGAEDFFDGGMYRESIWEAIGPRDGCVAVVKRLLHAVAATAEKIYGGR